MACLAQETVTSACARSTGRASTSPPLYSSRQALRTPPRLASMPPLSQCFYLQFIGSHPGIELLCPAYFSVVLLLFTHFHFRGTHLKAAGVVVVQDGTKDLYFSSMLLKLAVKNCLALLSYISKKKSQDAFFFIWSSLLKFQCTVFMKSFNPSCIIVK